MLVDIPGGQASVEVVPGGPEPLLWFEGGPGLNAALGRPDVELLSGLATGYLIDAPGCGGSSPPADEMGYTAAATAAFYDRVRRALGLERVTVVGHSWGATVALMYAAAFPDSCERCLSIAPFAGNFVDEDPGTATRHDAAFARHAHRPWYGDARVAFDSYGDPGIDDPNEARDRFGPAWPLYFTDPDSPQSRQHIERITREFTLDPATAKAAMRFVYDDVDLRRLPPATCPTLVIAGDLDIVCGTPHAEALERAVPDVEVCVSAGWGHMPQYEDPTGFMKAVSEWWEAGR